MNEKEKMIAGMNYDPLDPQLILLRDRASRLCHRYNKKTFHEVNLRSRLLRKLLRTEGNFWVKPPFYCDYGFNITLGNDVMLNYGCVLLDVCPITIGDKTLIGPNAGSQAARTRCGIRKTDHNWPKCLDWRRSDRLSGGDHQG